MILQSLTRLYETLVRKETLQQPGWSSVKVSWALELDREGELVNVLPLEREVKEDKKKGKKAGKDAIPMQVPAPVKRSSGVLPNFLCDNSSYILGIDEKGKPERSRKCFVAFRALHEKQLGSVEHPAARAILNFLRNWEPEQAAENPALTPYLSEIVKGGNIVFLCKDGYAHEIQAIAAACDDANCDSADEQEMICLVTGKRSPIARLHPSIKGVPGAQSSGAALVSFNASAYESFGWDGGQGYNAPVSKYAAFAYTEALNWLIRDEHHHRRMGDTMTVYWTEGDAEVCSWMFENLLDGVSDEDVNSAVEALAEGKVYRWENIPIDPSNRFYVLGLAPNAARLSVRFFLTDSFGTMMKNLVEHQKRLEMVKPSYEHRKGLAIWQMLRETVNLNSRDKEPLPKMAGDVARAVLQNQPYPTTLMQQIQLRIRAGEEITWGKASVIKAYLLKNVVDTSENHPYREVLSVSLHEESNCTPYVLGRLFSVLEGLQQAANPGINTTIRDRYFNSACSMPASVFPTLIKLAQAHLNKLDTRQSIYYDKQIQEIMSKLDMNYPKRLSLEEQGIFQIGYYHQTQKRYTKKEANENE